MRIVLDEAVTGAPTAPIALIQSAIRNPRSAIHRLRHEAFLRRIAKPRLPLQHRAREKRVCTMAFLKRAVVGMVIALACAGVYSALRNLPVASGCGFYGECPETADSESASPASRTVLPEDTAAKLQIR